jgi:hypothetical protein
MTLVISIRLLSLAFGHIDSQKKIRMLVIKPPYDTIWPAPGLDDTRLS